MEQTDDERLQLWPSVGPLAQVSPLTCEDPQHKCRTDAAFVRDLSVWPAQRPKLARALRISGDELQAALDDVTVIQAQPSERVNYALENPGSADLMVVAYLHERLRQLDESYDQASSTSLLGPAGHVHGQVKFLRENAGNPSHATLRMSFVALYGEKNPIRGVLLAQQAAEMAKLASPSLTGLSLLHVAEGHAMTGALKECEDALRKAEAQFDRVSTDDVAAPYYTVNEFNRLAGSCYLFLDLPERAEPILRTTTRALASKKKSQAIALGNLTLALIRQGKLDEAAGVMHRTIDAVELTRGGGGLNLAFSAGRELRQWRNEPWAQDINDRLLALMAAI